MAQLNDADKTSKEPIKGCIIEVDTVALGGVRRLYDLYASRLGALGVTLDEGLFGRYLLGTHTEIGLNRLLQASGRGGAADLAKEITEAYLLQLAEASVKESDAVCKLVAALAENQVKVGLITRLPEAAAATVLAPLLAYPNVMLLCEAHGQTGSFGWDVWRRSIVRMQMTDRLCVALVASASSGKPALAADLTVVVVADPLAAHQDFSGSNHVAEACDSSVTKAVLSALRIS